MTKKIEKIINGIADILMDIQQYKTDILFLSNNEEEYFKSVVEKSRFFHRVYWHSIKLLIIDLYKLLKANQDFSFRSAINYIKSNREKIKWHEQISLEKLNDLEDKLKLLENLYLEKIKTLRDKYYAHNDFHKEDYTIHLSLNDCWKLNNELQLIFNAIHYHLKKQTFLIDEFGDKPIEIIKVYKLKEIQKYLIVNTMNDKEIVSTTDLNRIIKNSNYS